MGIMKLRRNMIFTTATGGTWVSPEQEFLGVARRGAAKSSHIASQFHDSHQSAVAEERCAAYQLDMGEKHPYF